MFTRNRTTIFTIMLVLGVLLASCAPATAPDAGGGAAADTGAATGAEEAASDEVRTVIYLSAGTAEVEQDWNEKWVEEFNASRADIQIQYELVSWSDLLPKAAAMIASGTPPDIAWYAPSQIKEWYLAGQLEPLDDWLASDIEELLPPIANPESSDIYFDGHYYGMPFCMAGLGYSVRKDLMAEAGYDVEELGDWDWETFKEVAAAVTNPDENQYGTLVAFGDPRITAGSVNPFFQGNGLEGLADFSDPEAYIQTLQMIQDIVPYTPKAQIQWAHADTLTAYMNSVVVLNPTGSYFFGDIKRNAPEVMSDESTAVLPYPTGPKADANPVPWYTVGWVMFNASENKEAAAEVLHFLASREAVNEWPMNMAPKTELTIENRIAASEFGEEVRWWLDDWYTLLEEGTPVPRPGYVPFTEINQIFNEVLLRMYEGDLTPEEAYEELKASIEPITITEVE